MKKVYLFIIISIAFFPKLDAFAYSGVSRSIVTASILNVEDINKIKTYSKETTDADTNGVGTNSENLPDKVITQENIKSLQEYINNVSVKISQLTVGSNVTGPFKNELQEIQAMLTQAANLTDKDSFKAVDIIGQAQKKLKKLDQLVDLTNGSQEDLTEDDAVELQSLKSDIGEVEVEINKIVINGGDATALKSVLQEVKNMVSAAQEKINNHDTSGSNILIKKAHDRLDNLSDSIDGALDIAYDGSRKIIRDYNNSVSEVSQNLQLLAKIDPELGLQIAKIADSQQQSIDNVENLVGNIGARKGFIKFLLGSNASLIKELAYQVNINKKNIQSLKNIKNALSDDAISVVLQTQIQILQQQTASLEAYIQNNEGGYSLFGWIFKLII